MADETQVPDGGSEYFEEVCDGVVHQDVCVEAHVTVRPEVIPGRPHAKCIGELRIGHCREGKPEPKGVCEFTVHQKLCVEVPLKFKVKAEAKPGNIFCEEPMEGRCREHHRDDATEPDHTM
jgi:hypothetical protein